MGEVGNVQVEVILDTGSAVSLLCHKEARLMNIHQASQGRPAIELITNLREHLPVMGCVKALIQMTDTFQITHQFLVVSSLIYPVILGTDFLYQYQLSLDSTSIPEIVQQHTDDLMTVQPLWNAEQEAKAKRCAVAVIGNSNHDIVDECSIPQYHKPISFDIPTCIDTAIRGIPKKYQHFFRSTPGMTTLTDHYIPTTGNPICVPPRRIPGHFKQEVEQQIHEMLQISII